MTTTPRPVVLVHGAWHGAWCFAALQAELDRRGVPSYAIDLPGHAVSTLPLGDLHGDAQHVADSIAALSDVVLVGHSYGGAVISEVVARSSVPSHLVYLTAFVLEEGQSLMDRLTSMPPETVTLSSVTVIRDDGTMIVEGDSIVQAFYGECAPEVADAAIARLTPQPMATFGQPVSGSPQTPVPTTYVECLRDQAIHINHQRIMSAGCDEVAVLDTDHSPFASRVTETADILERIARSNGAS